MRRRALLAGGSAASVGWPFAAHAQQATRMRRIGYVVGQSDGPEARARIAAFRRGLAALGWTEGRNIEIVARFGAGDPERNRSYVRELIGLSPEVVVTSNSTTVSLLIAESRTLPIVFSILNDPIAQGFAESLARPGRNVTGFTIFELSTAAKWLELLKQIAPGVTQVAFLIDPQQPAGALYAGVIAAAAQSLNVRMTTVRVNGEADIVQAADEMASTQGGSLIMPPAPAIENRRALIFELTARRRLPAVWPFRFLVEEGGLMSYAPDVLDLFQRSASYVDRILRGANPGELPIQQPTRFEWVVNLRTAAALGLEISPFVLARIDHVIE